MYLPLNRWNFYMLNVAKLGKIEFQEKKKKKRKETKKAIHQTYHIIHNSFLTFFLFPSISSIAIIIFSFTILILQCGDFQLKVNRCYST